MAGEAGPGRKAQLTAGLGSCPAGYFRGEAVAKFSSPAWCLVFAEG